MNTQATVEATEYTVTLPVKPNTRQQVELFIDHMPQDLTGKTVIVDASNVDDITPSFTDELSKQILSVRKAQDIVVVSAPYRMKQYIQMLAKNRHYIDLISYRDEN